MPIATTAPQSSLKFTTLPLDLVGLGVYTRSMDTPPFKSYPDCTNCRLYEGAVHVGIPMEWVPESLPPLPDNPAVIVLGQNPGREEDKHGRNFIPRIGPWGASAGWILRNSYLAGIGLYERACVYLVNAARCGPESVQTPGPYNACIQYLEQDLRLVVQSHGPAEIIILATGAPALRSLYVLATGKPVSQKDFGSRQGERIHFDGVTPDPAVFSTYHPAYINRFPEKILPVHKHLDLLSRFLSGEPRPDPSITISELEAPP
jgi:uracil-DNA glycosylase family 4